MLVLVRRRNEITLQVNDGIFLIPFNTPLSFLWSYPRFMVLTLKVQGNIIWSMMIRS